MRLYEQLICTLPKDQDNVRDALVAAVPVMCDNVAEYLYTGTPQEVWDIRTDFPNVAPPWPLAFYEYTRPRYSNSEGTVVDLGAPVTFGLLVIAHEYDPEHAGSDEWILSTLPTAFMMRLRSRGLSTADIQEEFGADISSRALLAKVRALIGEEGVAAYLDRSRQVVASQTGIRWVLECISFSTRSARPIAIYRAPVEADGTQPIKNGPCCITASPSSAHQDADTIDAILHELEHRGYSMLHVPFLAMSLSHCKNVELIDGEIIDPKPRVTRRYGLGRTTYKVLQIEPMRKVLRGAGAETEGGTLQKALHICRGHFKDYRERGLFGKVKGRFWWDQTVRGSASAGRVEKSYQVLATP